MIIEEAQRLGEIKEYYFSKKLDELRKMEAKGIRVLNLGIGNPDLSPSEETVEQLRISAEDPRNHGYQPYRGIPALREGISQWSKKVYRIHLDPTHEILPLIGSKEGIFHIAMAFLNPGDQVLVPDPGYPAYAAVSKMVGAEVVRYALDETRQWRIDLGELREKDLSRVKIMWVNFPHMPTGRDADPEELRQLVALAKAHRFLLVNDNPYSLILNDAPGSLLQTEGAMEVGLELNSLSKSHNMAGWRLGWLAGAKDYIDAVLKVKSNIDSGMFKPLQMAAVKALQNPEEWHKEQNEVYHERRSMVYSLLEALHCTFEREQKGLFVWAKIPDQEESAAAFVDDILHKHHLFITPGFIFGSRGGRYIRVSLCTDQSLLHEALQRIQKDRAIKINT